MSTMMTDTTRKSIITVIHYSSSLEEQWHSSTKIDFIISTLNSMRKAFQSDSLQASQQYGNILIFSQWTAMLDDIAVCMNDE